MNSRNKEELKRIGELQKLQQNREFKGGLKLAGQILKKNPKCAEALAYKAYFTHLKDRNIKDECIVTIKEAIKLDMKNSLVWKIAGLLYKEMEDLTQYFQCYRLAAMHDPSDIMILSEICNINLYERKYETFLNDSRKMVQQNTSTYSVMRYALGLHLNNRITDAQNFLNTYQNAWPPTKSEDENVFRSEFIIYRSNLFFEMKQCEQCLEYINKYMPLCRDSVQILEIKVKCYKNMNNVGMAIECIDQLLTYYPENGDYFQIIEEILPPESIIPELFRIKAKIKSNYAHVRILELMDSSDSRFVPLLLEFIGPLLIKASPAVYVSLKDLPQKSLDLALDVALKTEVPLNAVPMVHLFHANVLYRKGKIEEAIQVLESGITHTPTCIELYSLKSRLLRYMGFVKESMVASNELYMADPADRNSNIIYVKSLFLFGDREEAERIANLFAGEDQGKQLLFETQFNTYYLHSAHSSLRCRDFATARKMYEGVIKHFDVYKKSQFSYIGAASRKPRVLLEILDYFSQIEKDKLYIKGAKGILRMGIMEQEKTYSKEVALRSLNSGDPELLALCIVVFSWFNLVIPALKCYLKIQNTPYKYMAQLHMNKMVSEALEKSNPIVQKVLMENPICGDMNPIGFEDYFSLSQGKSFFGDYSGSLQDMVHLITNFDFGFKKALKIFEFATIESKNPIMETEISSLLKSKYPMYQFEVSNDAKQYINP